MKNYYKRRSSFVLVVVHDAGSAEVIAAYISKHTKHTNFVSYVAGPAERIFRRERIPFHRIQDIKRDIIRVLKKYDNAEYVLLGTGWMTKIEFETLIEAKKIGIKTVVYLDSWTNFRKRFGYPDQNWRKNIPDELWVGDKYAMSTAKRYFKNTTLRLVPNQYIRNLVKRYRARNKFFSDPGSILFISGIVSVEEELLKETLIRLSGKDSPSTLRIRFHPTDSRKRYDEIIKRYRGKVYVQKSQEDDIVEDLVRAHMVIGTESMAMAAATLVGINVISVLPVGHKRILPFPDIIRVRNPDEAARLI